MKNRGLLFRFLGCVLFLSLCFFSFWPPSKKINLGLDLKGGMHLILKVDTKSLPKEKVKESAQIAAEILRNRIDAFGVKEPVIQTQGSQRILVQLPGIADRERALKIIGQTALLEFKLVEDSPQKIEAALKGNIPQGWELKEFKGTKVLIKKKPEITGKYLKDARVRINPESFNMYEVTLEFNSQGAKKFYEITKKNIGKRLAIVLDGKIKSMPVIREEIPGGKAQITGDFTYQEAEDLAIVLKAGALPCSLKIEEERTVGPLLGKDSITAGIKACIWGALLVCGYMVFYYWIFGLLSILGIVCVLIIILGSLGYFGATLTLPGIAGIILTLGMCVDANILIFERIKEERKLKRSVEFSVKNGFRRALRTILDANITTLIAAFFLFQFGTGPIKGFALTLSIGILATLFTALIFLRVILEFLVESKILKEIRMLDIFSNFNINFLKYRRVFLTLSSIIILAGIFLFFKKQKEIYGLDFSGGQLIELKFENVQDPLKLRKILDSANIKDVKIQQYKEFPQIITLKASADIFKKVVKVFNQNLKEKFQVLRIEKVGPVVGRELKKKAIKAIIFALGGILVYIGFRFKHFSFGLAGVIALFHDVFVTLSGLLFTNRLLDLLIITAFLTIAGYSVNDTIVVYDRIRELMIHSKKEPLISIINKAINQTLSRTLNTSLTTILVVLSLYLFGGRVLNDFSFSLLIGFIAGTYSSIYIASSLVLFFEKK